MNIIEKRGDPRINEHVALAVKIAMDKDAENAISMIDAGTENSVEADQVFPMLVFDKELEIVSLSVSGLGFNSQAMHDKASMLLVTMRLGKSTQDIRAIAQVTHSEARGETYYTGIYFERISELNKNLIHDFINKTFS